MTRAKKSRRARTRRPARRKASQAKKRARAPQKRTRPATAEDRLLDLARTLTAMASADAAPRVAVTSALDALAKAFHADAALPHALAQARIATRRDKPRALALAWAREQLRQGLGEILGRAAAAGELRVALPPESLAWFALAACEALADEPPQAAPDRIRLLTEWLTGPRGDG